MIKLVFVLFVLNLGVDAGHPPVFSDIFKCEVGLHYYGGNEPGKSYKTVKLEDITATDINGDPLKLQCLDQYGIQCSYVFGKQYKFNIGDTFFSMIATDRFGESNSCNVTVTIGDIEPPRFSNQKCQLATSCRKTTVPGKPYAIVKIEDSKVTDNSGNVTMSCSSRFNSEEFKPCKYKFGKEFQFEIGSTEVHIIATDKSGGSSTCSFYVFVEDNEAPKFWFNNALVQKGIISQKNAMPGENFAMIKIVDIKVSDNSGIAPKISCHQYTTVSLCQYEFGKEYKFKVGETAITYTATDKAGYSTSIYIRIVVKAFCPPLMRTSKHVSEVNGNKSFTENREGGTYHMFECAPGFRINHASYECTKNGTWNPPKPPTCTDIQPPKFSKEKECLFGIKHTVNTLPGKSYATIKLDDMKVMDNSGISPIIKCLAWTGGFCNYEFGKEFNFNIGETSFRIKAIDQAGLYSYCRFQVIVKDVEPPKLIHCPSYIIKEATTQYVKITWEQPKYIDNSGKLLNIHSNFVSGSRFHVPSRSIIRYHASDSSHNLNNECTFIVEVKQQKADCTVPAPPANGAVVFGERTAVVVCRTGYNPTTMIPLASCMNKMWNVVTSPGSKLSDVKCMVGGTPSGFTFTADCNSIQGKKGILNIVSMMFGPTGFKNPTISCGQKI